jgi:branched-chain amino acid transport system permease protein
MVGAYAAFLTRTHVSDNIVVIIVLSAVAALVVGLVVERVAIRPTRGRYFLVAFVATIGVSVFLQNAAQRLFGVDPKHVATPLPGVQQLGGVIASNMQLLTLGLAVVMMVGVSFYVRKTKWGRATRAIAEKPEVAAALGVDINRVSQLTVGLASVLAGVAGATIALSQEQAAPLLGVTYGLKAFIAMLIAGNRHIEGIMAVGLVLGVAETLIAGYVSSNIRDVVAFTLLIGVLYFRPNGLFGSYERER